MGIVVNLDEVMAKRKISLGELSSKVNVTPANMSILKTGKAKAIRFSTLEAICKALNCQPGDILEYENEENTVHRRNYRPEKGEYPPVGSACKREEKR